MVYRLESKVALVIGPVHGQGAAHADLLARQSNRAIATDVLDGQGEAAEQLDTEGLEAFYRHLDVTSESRPVGGFDSELLISLCAPQWAARRAWR